MRGVGGGGGLTYMWMLTHSQASPGPENRCKVTHFFPENPWAQQSELSVDIRLSRRGFQSQAGQLAERSRHCLCRAPHSRP